MNLTIPSASRGFTLIHGHSRSIRVAAIPLVFLGATFVWPSAAVEPRPENAIEAIMDTYDRFPIVALGMSHWQQDEAEFSLALIRDPRFAVTVNDIVVECGNVLYQATLDRYIDGGEVPLEQLQLVWRNTTQPGSCDPPQHKELLDAVREVNSRLPAGHHLRVLAGDPPIDWDKIQRPEDILPFMTQRDTNFASVVEEQVLARHRKALLVIGAAHVLRKPISWASSSSTSSPTITMLIESKYPHATYVVTPHDGFGDRNAELEPRLANWPKPSVTTIRGTWLGLLNAGVIFRGKIRRVGSDPSKVEDPFPGLMLQDIADGYLYLEPIASIRRLDFPHETGTAYARELDRRRNLEGGGPIPNPSVPRPK
jgi:hypothetical protein